MLQISELMTLGWLRGDFSLSSAIEVATRQHINAVEAREGRLTERWLVRSLAFFCVNGMEPIWTLPSRFGLGITLIYVDWLHYYVHCAHPTLRCEAALIRAAAAASSMSMPLCFGVPKRPLRLPRAHPRGSHRANAV